MKILGIECSAASVSASVTDGEKILSEAYANNGLTHSVTLLPQIKSALEIANTDISDIDVIALSAGPGSFTGLRIGAATAKGLALDKTKCMGVSTLEAMAFSHTDFDGIVCACMDARCMQFYNAIFEISNGEIKRICEDRALMTEELFSELKNIKKSILLVGDGAKLCYNRIQEICPKLKSNVRLASEDTRYQRASGVCKAALSRLESGEEPCSANDLNLKYLRLPQAERELKKRESKK